MTLNKMALAHVSNKQKISSAYFKGQADMNEINIPGQILFNIINQ